MVNKRIRSPAPAMPVVFLHGIDGYEITSTPTPVEWAHSHFITSDFSFINNTTQIRINRGAKGRIYKITTQMSAERTGGNPDELVLKIYINGVAQDCCEAHGAMSNTGVHGNITLVILIYANSGDYIEIYASVDAGTVETEPNTVRIIVEGLPIKGWDNNAGGSDINDRSW